MALVRLEEFEAEWGKRYQTIGRPGAGPGNTSWPSSRSHPASAMIYITNAVEALHRRLRKIIKTRGTFPNDHAALKLLWLAIKNADLR
jgi:putative transposase